MIEEIKKRNGRVVEFDSSKITAAIAKAGQATGEFGEREAKKMTLRVLTLAHELRLGPTPEVEEIQDIVERVLLDSPYYIDGQSVYHLPGAACPDPTHRHQSPCGSGGALYPQTGLEDKRKQQYVLFPAGAQQLHLLGCHLGILAQQNLSTGNPAGSRRRRPAYP